MRSSDESPFPSRRWSSSLLVAVVLLSLPAFAQAQGDEKSKVERSAESMTEAERQKYQKFLQEGKSAYASKNFEKAFQKLKAAHDIHPKPSILFNLGLISEKQGKLERASEYYGKFTKAPDVSLKARKRASSRMAAVNDILSKSGESQAQQQTNLMPALEAMNAEVDEGVSAADQNMSEGDASTDEPSEEPAEEDEGERAETSPTEPETGETGGSTGAGPGTAKTGDRKVKYGWPVYASYGAGTAALAAGVVTLAMTNDRIDKAKEAGGDPSRAQEHLDYEDEASTLATTTAGLFTGGALLIGVGSYFVIRYSKSVEQQRRAEDEGKPKVSISVGDEFTGARLSVDF